jgi:hypothetical protein
LFADRVTPVKKPLLAPIRPTAPPWLWLLLAVSRLSFTVRVESATWMAPPTLAVLAASCSCRPCKDRLAPLSRAKRGPPAPLPSMLVLPAPAPLMLMETGPLITTPPLGA